MSRARRPVARRSRRRFLGALAAGTAAALTSPLIALAADTAKTPAKAAAAPAPAKTPPPATKPATAPVVVGGKRVADANEIEKLKGYTDDALKALRAYPLPTGSVMGFVFKPVRVRRGKKGA